MMRQITGGVLALALSFGSLSTFGAGDAKRGAAAFRQCAACHSLEPDRHLTGPSLAGIVGRKAGTVAGFGRYSTALMDSGIDWGDEPLDRWLTSPGRLVPGTSMRIPGIADPSTRQDLIAFLKTAAKDSTSGVGGMMGGMRGGRLPNLEEATLQQTVTAIRYCGDAYYVNLGTGVTETFWEFNLRFKTDSSPDGPAKGRPVIVGAGMRGDRAQVVFSDPEEFSVFIRKDCGDPA
jgi:cytochrome c